MEVLKIIGTVILWIFAVVGFVDSCLALRDRFRRKPITTKEIVIRHKLLPDDPSGRLVVVSVLVLAILGLAPSIKALHSRIRS